MEEIWKPIPGYEGRYEVSNNGRVKSLSRLAPEKNGRVHRVNERILKARITARGYMRVTIFKENHPIAKHVHTLVAMAFIPNPNGYSQVNHKNEIKTDNRVSNLEWCDSQYNINYGTALIRRAIKRGVPVVQMDLNGNVIARYYSATEAARISGARRTSIYCCCHGKYQMAGGFKWKYAHE